MAQATRVLSPVSALALALVPVSVSGQASTSARDALIWHWFGDCANNDSLVLEVTFDGKPIYSGDELVAIVSESEIGRRLKVDFLRDKKARSTEIEVGDRSKIVGDLESRRDDQGKEAPAEGGGVLGVAVRNLPRDEAQEIADQLHLGGTQGVMVVEVKAGAFASDLGLQRGDIVLEINHRPATSVE